MKKTLLTAVSAAALALPGVALAAHDDGAANQNREHQGVEHQGAGHHRGQRGRAHDASSHKRREVRGAVASFTGGVLTITSAGGSTVSGKVTERTVLECPAATASAASHGDSTSGGTSEDGGRDGQGNSGPSSAGKDDPAGHDVGDDNGQDNTAAHDVGDDNGVDPAGHDVGDDNGQDEAEHCTTAALVSGAVVREAKLGTSGADAVWQKVELGR